MGTTMNRESYEKLVAENIEWLKKNAPHSCERMHILAILEGSSDSLYGGAKINNGRATVGNRIYFDTEFMEDGKTIDLISIGMIKDNGQEYYAISSEFDATKANDWVKENVLTKLDDRPRKTRETIAAEILAFVGDAEPEFWAYFADYDWVVLCQLFGRMIDLPKGWPMYCNDLKQLAGQKHLPQMEKDEHNALADAKWVRDSFYNQIVPPQPKNPVENINDPYDAIACDKWENDNAIAPPAQTVEIKIVMELNDAVVIWREKTQGIIWESLLSPDMAKACRTLEDVVRRMVNLPATIVWPTGTRTPLPEGANQELENLVLFKKNTHILLDEAGVPKFENEKCRVSRRIRWLAGLAKREPYKKLPEHIWKEATDRCTSRMDFDMLEDAVTAAVNADRVLPVECPVCGETCGHAEYCTHPVGEIEITYDPPASPAPEETSLGDNRWNRIAKEIFTAIPHCIRKPVLGGGDGNLEVGTDLIGHIEGILAREFASTAPTETPAQQSGDGWTYYKPTGLSSSWNLRGRICGGISEQQFSSSGWGYASDSGFLENAVADGFMILDPIQTESGVASTAPTETPADSTPRCSKCGEMQYHIGTCESCQRKAETPTDGLKDFASGKGEKHSVAPADQFSDGWMYFDAVDPKVFSYRVKGEVVQYRHKDWQASVANMQDIERDTANGVFVLRGKSEPLPATQPPTAPKNLADCIDIALSQDQMQTVTIGALVEILKAIKFDMERMGIER